MTRRERILFELKQSGSAFTTREMWTRLNPGGVPEKKDLDRLQAELSHMVAEGFINKAGTKRRHVGGVRYSYNRLSVAKGWGF